MYKFIIILVITLLITIQGAGQSLDVERVLPPAVERIAGDRATLDLFFDELPQGRAGLLRLRGDNLERATALVFNQKLDFFQVAGKENELYAFLVAGLNQSAREYEMIVTAEFARNQPVEQLQTLISVVPGGFIQEVIVLPEDDRILELLDPQIEQDELALIFSIASTITEEPLWDEAGFVPPLASELTSPFGSVRTFNSSYESRHTGWDFQATIGLPMRAMAAGRVAFAGMLPIRGNYVLIDHGLGIYSGYAHFSVSYVTQGQQIHAGQIIGQVGSTGRSSSAHAHVEFIMDGEWVDVADFLRMPIP